ncbi:MAG: M20/M25/M40 family metallo-hydrolase [Clostridia bacterium]|nr:M20/M25/M40 family metallo-hydrolase [Clostridia bacterium]
MKANESIEKYPARVREYTNYALKSTKIVAKNYGPRPAGSEADAKAREYLKSDTAKFCDEMKEEEFRCSDKAFMSWVSIGSVLLLVSAVLFAFGLQVIALAVTLLNVFFIVSEFFFYKPVLDVFFKKKETGNIIGVRKASGETKKRIIFCGHTDSAYEWTYTYHGGRPFVALAIVIAIISIVISIAGCVFAIVENGAISPSVAFLGDNLIIKIFSIVMFALIPCYVYTFFFCNYKRPVTGAIDNLTGCFASLAVVKFLFDNNIRFENTEVQVLLTGGEEAGTRGAQAYAKAHKDELCDKNIETVFVGVDTIHDFDFMNVISKDMNGFVKNDERVVKLIKDGAVIAGYDNVTSGPISLGSTDSAPLSQIGVPAATFVAMDPTPARYYHTRLDNEEILEPKTMEATVKIALETAFLFDEKGI